MYKVGDIRILVQCLSYYTKKAVKARVLDRRGMFTRLSMFTIRPWPNA